MKGVPKNRRRNLRRNDLYKLTQLQWAPSGSIFGRIQVGAELFRNIATVGLLVPAIQWLLEADDRAAAASYDRLQESVHLHRQLDEALEGNRGSIAGYLVSTLLQRTGAVEAADLRNIRVESRVSGTTFANVTGLRLTNSRFGLYDAEHIQIQVSNSEESSLVSLSAESVEARFNHAEDSSIIISPQFRFTIHNSVIDSSSIFAIHPNDILSTSEERIIESSINRSIVSDTRITIYSDNLYISGSEFISGSEIVILHGGRIVFNNSCWDESVVFRREGINGINPQQILPIELPPQDPSCAERIEAARLTLASEQED